MAVSQTVSAPVHIAPIDAASRVLARPPRTYLQEVVGRLRRNRIAMVGLSFIVLLVIMAVGTRWLAPYDFAAGSLVGASRLPSTRHWLGTDAPGRDEMTPLSWGARGAVPATR